MRGQSAAMMAHRSSDPLRPADAATILMAYSHSLRVSEISSPLSVERVQETPAIGYLPTGAANCFFYGENGYLMNCIQLFVTKRRWAGTSDRNVSLTAPKIVRFALVRAGIE